MILQSPRWWIFRVGIPFTTWRICCSLNWNDPQIGMGSYPIWDRSPNRFGDPHTSMGIGFFLVFQSRTKSAFSQQKFRQSQRHGAPLLAKNLGNQHTAPANQELSEQEKGRESLAAARQGRQHQRWWRWRKEWWRCTAQWRQRNCSSSAGAWQRHGSSGSVSGSVTAQRWRQS